MMKDTSSNRAQTVNAEACAWIAQLESGEMTAEDLAALKEWMSRSPAHKAEIRRLAYLSQDLNMLGNLAGPLDRAMSAERKRQGYAAKRGWRFTAAVAATLVVCAVVLLALFRPYATDEPRLLATAVGEIREATLPDGSILKLNTDTTVEIDFTDEHRRIRLLKGEALFIVAHNKARPFMVDAHGRVVTAVGTAFSVTLLPREFEVLVTEGRVKLKDGVSHLRAQPREDGAARSEAPDLLLKAGQQVSYDEAERMPVRTLSKREIERRLAWQAGFIEFTNAPLQDVIDDLGRYTPLTIEIADPELRDVSFGGIFRINELDALFHALESNFDIKVQYLDKRHIKLSRKEPVYSSAAPSATD